MKPGLCECGCGGETKIVHQNDAARGSVKGQHRRFLRGHGTRGKAHGLGGKPPYNTWKAMIARCTKPAHPAYRHYGGRGITVCERWLSLDNFIADMGMPPAGAEIDRIDNEGNYEKSNCRWTDRSTQMRNTRRIHVVVIGGAQMALIEACEKYGKTVASVSGRLKRGWSIEDALTTPVPAKTYRKRINHALEAHVP